MLSTLGITLGAAGATTGGVLGFFSGVTFLTSGFVLVVVDVGVSSSLPAKFDIEIAIDRAAEANDTYYFSSMRMCKRKGQRMVFKNTKRYMAVSTLTAMAVQVRT